MGLNLAVEQMEEVGRVRSGPRTEQYIPACLEKKLDEWCHLRTNGTANVERHEPLSYKNLTDAMQDMLVAYNAEVVTT